MSNSKYLAFAAAAKWKNLTKAAEILGYTQSGVSHLIATLENELGITLFMRSRNGVELTNEGKLMLPYVQRLLSAEEDIAILAKDLRGIYAGQLRIGTISSVAISYLPPVLQDFKTECPGIEVTVKSGDYSWVEHSLVENEIDCGFVNLPSRPEFLTVPIIKDRLLAIVNSRHKFADCTSLLPQDFADVPFIVPAEGIHCDIGKYFAQTGVTPRVQFEMSDDYAAISMVRQGLGITVLSELMVQGLPRDNLRVIPLGNSEREIGVALYRTRYIPLAAKAFVEFITGKPIDTAVLSGV